MASDYDNNTVRPEARLIILKALSMHVYERLHSGMLEDELLAFGIDKPRELIHAELDWLAEMGVLRTIKIGSVVVATLTERGARFLRRAVDIEGIKRPARPGS
jgi:hypothetical protein